MAVKSIIDIEINDDSFKAFSALYERYNTLLSKAPGQWGQANRVAKTGFESVAAALMAQNDMTRMAARGQESAGRVARATARHWHDMARDTREVAGNIARATSQLLKWTALTSVFSGLLGAGGLFGIDRMAGTVGAGRRAASGLGLRYGERAAFDTNYGRLVDEGFLSNVNEVLHDVTRRHALYGAGLTEGQVAGKNTAEVGALLVPALKRLADQTNPSQMSQVLQSRGLGQIIGLQEFQRLRNTPASEMSQISRQYGADTRSLDLGQGTQKAWQDFGVQMHRAGQMIENVFVRGLEPLVPPLSKLSESFARSVDTLLSNPHLSEWITKFGDAIEGAARYLGTDEFQHNIRTFVDGVGKLASKVASVASWFADSPEDTARHQAEADKRAQMRRDRAEGRASVWSQFTDIFSGAGTPGNTPINNPGNLRPPGASSGFMQYPTTDAGLRAMARQLQLYQSRDKLDTIQGIVSKYAPSTENDVRSYVGDVSRRTGFSPDQHLDLSDRETLARLISAMTKHENSRSNYSPKTVVEVLNNTGGSAIVTTNQVAQ